MEVTIAPAQLLGFSHRYQTGSQPMVLYDARGNNYLVKFAEKVERGTGGLAREYLAGPLAEMIEAPVPSTTFVELTTGSLALDTNIVFADGTRPVPQVTVGSAYISNAASPVSPMAFEWIPDVDLAGVLVFNTWVSVGDRHWGNYIIQSTSDGPRLVSVDYATCLSLDQPVPTVGDPDLVPFMRKASTAVEAYLHRLQRLAERQIRQAFARVPRPWLADAERERMVHFLLSGRALTAQVISASLA